MVRITLRVSPLIDNSEMLYGSYYIESFPTDRQLWDVIWFVLHWEFPYWSTTLRCYMVRITLRVSPLIDNSEVLYGSYYTESFPTDRQHWDVIWFVLHWEFPLWSTTLRCYMVRITLRVSPLIDNSEMLYGSYYIESFPSDRQLWDVIWFVLHWEFP